MSGTGLGKCDNFLMVLLPAGDFSAWIAALRVAIGGTADSEVPCGDCTACCTASQFVHVGPDETDTLAHIPKALLFPAPRRPDGYQLLGYDERGHCPMLVNGLCSIYEHRPRTCRTYDCRVFAAAGIEPSDPDKSLIAERMRRWRFSYGDATGPAQHDATRRAAAWLRAHSADLAEDIAPRSATQLAVMACETGELFVGTDSSTRRSVVVEPSSAVITERIWATTRRPAE